MKDNLLLTTMQVKKGIRYIGMAALMWLSGHGFEP
jgi:hypothetical protein